MYIDYYKHLFIDQEIINKFFIEENIETQNNFYRYKENKKIILLSYTGKKGRIMYSIVDEDQIYTLSKFNWTESNNSYLKCGKTILHRKTKETFNRPILKEDVIHHLGHTFDNRNSSLLVMDTVAHGLLHKSPNFEKQSNIRRLVDLNIGERKDTFEHNLNSFDDFMRMHLSNNYINISKDIATATIEYAKNEYVTDFYMNSINTSLDFMKHYTLQSKDDNVSYIINTNTCYINDIIKYIELIKERIDHRTIKKQETKKLLSFIMDIKQKIIVLLNIFKNIDDTEELITEITKIMEASDLLVKAINVATII